LPLPLQRPTGLSRGLARRRETCGRSGGEVGRPHHNRDEEGQVKQVLEDKDALAACLHRSPNMLDALLMTFTFSD
jgi:hypothetical protein